MRELTFGSVFAGIGGFDLALVRAGWRCLWEIENDAFCRRVLERRFPGVPVHGDVRAVAMDALAPVDLLCGGFPCQDLSVAGKRAGLRGSRSGLFFEFMRVASDLRPHWLLIENVPGWFSSHQGRDFAAALVELDERGYDPLWVTLDSRHFGVPQRRRRVFLVGHLRGACRCAPEVLLEPEGGAGHPPAGGEAGARIAAGLTSGAHHPGVHAPGRRQEDDENLIANSDPTMERQMLVAHALAAEGADASEDGTGRGAPLVIQDARAVDKAQHGLGVSDGTGAQGIAQNQRGEVLETEYAHQLTSGGGKPGEGYPAARIGAAVRRLTPMECERLQGFPDSWTCLCGASEAMLAERGVAGADWRRSDYRTLRLEGHTARCRCPDSARYRALGNAVTVSVVQWIGGRLAEIRRA